MNTYRLPRHPRTDRIFNVTLEGATLTVGLGFEDADRDERGPIPAQVWVEHVQIAGAWYDAIDVLADGFLAALNAQLLAEIEAERREAA